MLVLYSLLKEKEGNIPYFCQKKKKRKRKKWQQQQNTPAYIYSEGNTGPTSLPLHSNFHIEYQMQCCSSQIKEK